jgi:hypothetical protein
MTIPETCPTVKAVVVVVVTAAAAVVAMVPLKLTVIGVIMNQFPLASGTKF